MQAGLIRWLNISHQNSFSPESFTNLNQLTLYPKKNIKGQAKTGGNIIFNKVYFKKFCKQLSVVLVKVLIKPIIVCIK